MNSNAVKASDRMAHIHEARKKEAIEKVEAQEKIVEKVSEKSKALGDLAKLATAYFGTIENLASLFAGQYDARTMDLTTEDSKDPSFYAEVITGSNFKQTNFEFSVIALAKAASFSIAIDNTGTVGIPCTFDIAGEMEPANIEGDITITIGVDVLPITIVKTDTAQDIADKINDSFYTNNESGFSAQLINNNQDASYIMIEGAEGDDRVVSFGFVAGAATDHDLYGVHLEQATQSTIKFNKYTLESKTGSFKNNLPGLEIRVKNVNTEDPNTPGVYKKQKVQFVASSQPFIAQLDKALVAYNTLAEFLATQDDEGVLRNDDSVNKVKGAMFAFAGYVNGKSITDVGIVADYKSDVPILTLNNQEDFNQKMQDMESVKSLFLDNATITPVLGNLGARLIMLGLNGKLAGSVQNTEFNISITLNATSEFSIIDGNYATNEVTATINGEDYNPEIIEKDSKGNFNIRFADGSILVGLSLYLYPKAVVSSTENFTLTITNGIANLAKIANNSVFNAENTGSLNIQLEQDKINLDREKEKLERYETERDEKIKKIDADIEEINRRSEFANLYDFDSLLGLKNDD